MHSSATGREDVTAKTTLSHGYRMLRGDNEDFAPDGPITPPILSEKDAAAPLLRALETMKPHRDEAETQAHDDRLG